MLYEILTQIIQLIIGVAVGTLIGTWFMSDVLLPHKIPKLIRTVKHELLKDTDIQTVISHFNSADSPLPDPPPLVEMKKMEVKKQMSEEEKEHKITLTITLPTKETVVKALTSMFPGIKVSVKEEEPEALTEEEAEETVEETSTQEEE